MSRDSLDFYGALVWYLARPIALIIATAALGPFLHGLETRGEQAMKEHQAVLQRQIEQLKDLEQSRNDHRAIWQRLAQ